MNILTVLVLVYLGWLNYLVLSKFNAIDKKLNMFLTELSLFKSMQKLATKREQRILELTERLYKKSRNK